MTSVYGTIQIVAAALHAKNGAPETALYLGQLCQPFIQRTQINCVQVSAWLIEADGRCGQPDVCGVQSGQACCHGDLSYM